MPNVNFCADAYSCAEAAEALVIYTEWDAFRAFDLDWIKQVLARQMIVDLRNLYRQAEMKWRGVTYISICQQSIENVYI